MSHETPYGLPKNVSPELLEQIVIAPEKLKCCELCSALNLDVNKCCFVCGWHGRFDHDQLKIHAALRLISLENQEINPLLFTDPLTIETLLKPASRWRRFFYRLGSFFTRFRKV